MSNSNAPWVGGVLTNIFQHVFLPLSEKVGMVLHPVSALKPKMLDNIDLGSCSATRWAGTHFITPAVHESIQTSILQPLR